MEERRLLKQAARVQHVEVGVGGTQSRAASEGSDSPFNFVEAMKDKYAHIAGHKPEEVDEGTGRNEMN